MLNRLIEDINLALDNEAYFSALSLVLTLPDICGKAKYPSEKSTRKRYIDWYDEYVGQYEQCPCDVCKETKMPYLSGEVVYSLRNSFLHQGTPNIDNSSIKEDSNQIDTFTLVIEKKNEFDIYSDASSIVSSNQTEDSRKSYRVNIRRLCLILTLSAKNYYNKNREKFDFFYYNVLDWDKEVSTVKLTTNWME